MAEKYKLIIVDDEYLVRMGLKETVDWQSLSISVVAECENGAEALEAVKKFRPDLIISDVRMPVMDGLALAEKLARDSYDGAIIFYSGYSDFEYVRKALEYGVSGYVLKPVENTLLTDKVKETLAALEEVRKKRDALESLTSGAEYIKQMYFSRLGEGDDDKTLRDQLAVLNISVPTEGIALYGNCLRTDEEAFSKVFSELVKTLENFKVTGYINGGKFILITGLCDGEALYTYAERLLEEQYSDTVFTCIGISSLFGKGTTLGEAVTQAKKLASPVLPLGGVYTSGGIFHTEGKKPKRVIEDALALIYEHYPEKITVKWVADKLFVSESHLMHLFKDEVGNTFNDCLKNYRIVKAKEFLKQGNMRIKEVAAAVGFSDVRYFGQVFKELTGVTPSEFMEEDED